LAIDFVIDRHRGSPVGLATVLTDSRFFVPLVLEDGISIGNRTRRHKNYFDGEVLDRQPIAGQYSPRVSVGMVPARILGIRCPKAPFTSQSPCCSRGALVRSGLPACSPTSEPGPNKWRNPGCC